MTPGNNGASTPEDDDPFGYLYADGQANGAQPPSGGYGYPNSVNRVRPVGTRQYGAPQGQAAPPQQGAYGQPQGAYGQPNAHYAAPETFPGGGGPGAPQQPSGRGGGGGRRGPNTKGLLIGAVAVVAAVVIGIVVAMTSSGTDDDKSGDEAGGGTTPTQSQSTEPSPSASDDDAEKEVDLPSADAKAMRLGGPASLASDVEGAESDGGVYVANLNQPGASVTWTVNGIPEDGLYTLFTTYSAAGEDQSMTLTVNGKEFGSKLNLGNFAQAKDGDFAKGWTKTYAWPTLNKGTNTITLSCTDGDKCDVLLDQFSLKKGQVKN
ncbi:MULTISPECIES: carbohydrate-binding protein [Streptomyces]|uniref:Carbohydrate-binding protein n=1 Tax=Streptomyces ardesiacus TaxID=285564 RepID=A0ABW8H368_9ACTN|nr:MULTISPECIES: carbohydrate-binding protein [Streptomyces]KOU01960.1 carbohydrate-binding protein [Streptomyces sp. NRRL F-4711]KOX39094.1 carbohydrate-binding protein [Streptomyces sp. NRRL F-4707]